MDDLGTTIRELRQMREWSMGDLADRSGVSTKHVGHLERGEYCPTVRTVKKIAGAFDCRPSDLLKDAGL